MTDTTLVPTRLEPFEESFPKSEKIHRQLEIVWESDRLRTLGCPLLFYAARKPERLARIMMASAVLQVRPEYVRTHHPDMLQKLLAAAQASSE